MEEEQESEAKEITASRKQPSRELGLRVTRNGFWRRRRKRASERVRDVEWYQQNRHYQNCLTVSSSSSSSSKKSKNQSSIKLFLSST
ncbi:hypothetical protein PanWU01x14_096450, partial [Parasponia andersonii]